MFTLKKTIASTLACAMILGTSLLPSQALTKAEFEDGVDYQLSTREYSTDSMNATAYATGAANTFTCSFHPDAEVLVSEDGETATLTVYVANDENIKFFGSVISTSIFGVCSVEYNGQSYAGSILYSGDNDNAPVKEFNKTPTSTFFVNMTAGESYACDVLTVPNLPVEIFESLDTALKFDYSVNEAVGTLHMNQKLELDIVLDYEEVPEEEEVEPVVEEKQVTITATKSAITAAEPDYSITIPTTVVAPTLVADEDATFTYSVTVDLKNTTSVTVSSCTEGVLTSSDNDELPFTNTFTTETCTEGGLKYGTVTISKENIAKAVAGDYTGTINFEFSFTA